MSDDFDAFRRDLVEIAKPAAPRPGAKGRVRAALARRFEAQARFRTTLGYFAAAAAAALLVLGMAYVRRGTSVPSVAPPRASGDVTVASFAPSTPSIDASRTNLELASGARVVVEPGSTLTTEIDAPMEGRLALATGEILFHAEKRPGRLFEIAANDVRIRVVGALFGVRNDSRGVAVSVFEGAVTVGLGAGSFELTAGSTWPLDAAPIVLRESALAWVRGARNTLATTEIAPALPPASMRPSLRAPSAPSSSASSPLVSPQASAQAYREAKELERAGDFDRAASAYATLAAAGGEHAEDAQFALGRLAAKRFEAGAASDAEPLEAFGRYRARFPNGRYARDVDVHVLGILVARGDSVRALDACARFLGAHSNDSRAYRFRIARASILANRGAPGDCAAALRDLADARDANGAQDAQLEAPIRARCAPR